MTSKSNLMMKLLPVWIFCYAAREVFSFTANSNRITPSRTHHPPSKLLASSENKESSNGVQAASLEGLGDDHESVGENMSKSVAAWLDAEWMPQEIHVKMGISVKTTYVHCRSNGIDDVAEIMTKVTDNLFANWSEYNADAFVNAWDVGNYVADYLIAKSGSETCGCSAKIVE